MLLGDKINAVAALKNLPQSSSRLVHRLGHYESYERQLNKLKFHLKMKRRIYDDTEFKSINQRLKFCEAFFKKQKYRMMREEADKILCDSRKSRANTYHQMKDKLELSKKARVKLVNITGKAENKVENFRVNVQTEQSSLSESRLIMQYELTPIVQKKLSKSLQRRKIKTTVDQKQQNQRYVSEFQKKIKKELSKISFIKDVDSHQSQGQTSDLEEDNRYYIDKRQAELAPIFYYSQNRGKDARQQRKRSNLIYQSPNRGNDARQQSKSSNLTSLSNSPVPRYFNLKNSLVSNRKKLKDQHLREIAKVRDQQMDFMQKSQILRNMTSKYDYQQKNKDDKSLQLMCQATLARADALLQA